jgi:hypothetical protein
MKYYFPQLSTGSKSIFQAQTDADELIGEDDNDKG